ncbi:immunity 22 family protein [uncultured Maribacter sp.]|uniref:immunity 22 family protein n=1 Tax=uncultured Maribacter sp. TaxID=431308 RepID=UPI0026311DA3|nr:immunity 22 family protein [uncultured Maribacter sp.]
MKKNHIWVGAFSDEKEFDLYINQEKYLKAWSIYDNEPPTGNPEEDEEPSEELRCQFCKDIHIDTYDEDFLTVIYKNEILSSDFLALIPANPNIIIEKLKISNFNSLIIIDSAALDKDAIPENTSKLTYLGELEEIISAKINQEHIQYSIWIGNTKKTEEEFTSYFAGGPNKSPFSIDTNIRKYNPFSVKWHHFPKPIPINNIVTQFIPSEISESVINKARIRVGNNANAIFFYIANEYRENEPTKIILKEFAEDYPVPPKFQVEKENYNDLLFIGSFKHEN